MIVHLFQLERQSPKWRSRSMDAVFGYTARILHLDSNHTGQTEKLKRRATSKGRTAAESAMIRAFNAQFAEYSSELKIARAVMKKESDTGVRLRDKYWPVSAFGVAINVLHEEAVLDFCRKEGVKCGLYKYVEGLIERKTVSFALREADNLRAVLKEMERFEVPVSSMDGNCLVDNKRKDIGSVLGHGGETSSKKKRRLTRKK
ncbi:F27J15.12 [Arabidopsis thaliana]|uniref:F27J15.12 n=1 Tax=Arabidopsis thaliana TaxID=3702 RepID=Q9M9B1_ARATH|nr:F27J15.12 [Arabidopsis thaliana]